MVESLYRAEAAVSCSEKLYVTYVAEKTEATLK